MINEFNIAGVQVIMRFGNFPNTIRRLIGTTIGYLILLFLYSIKPIKFVVVVRLRVDRIGHLAYNTHILLKQLEGERRSEREILYLGVADKWVANSQLFRMYKRRFAMIQDEQRKFWVIQNKLAYLIVSTLLFTKSTTLFKNVASFNDTDFPFNLYDPEPILSFTSSEEEKGKNLLSQIGIDENSWFICFHARDPVYLSTLEPNADTSHHNFRDCDVKDYLEAAKYIVSCGGFALRMGHLIAEKLPDLHTPQIIDYASHYRSDFGDIYLSAKCKFFLGNTAGIFLAPLVFGVPIACANFVHIELLNPFRKGDLFLPKKIWSIEEKRFLSFREILESGIGRYMHSEEYTRAGLELIENTPQEILDLAQEMNERLNGTFEITEEDEELQRKFQALFQPHHYCYGTPVRIGTRFLRQNQELLD